MLVLAIETATHVCSVALVAGESTLAARVLPPEVKAAKELAPAIQAILAEAGKSLDDVTGLAVDVGPGSFTGLRVGTALAKGLAYARDLPVYGVSSLDVLAEQASFEGGRFYATLDAYRGQIFVKQFPDTPARSAEVVDLDAWLRERDASAPVYGQFPKGRLADVRAQVDFLPGGDQAVPQAEAVGRLASRRIAAGEPPDDLFALLPVYLRKSAAEEKADANDLPSG